MTQTPAQGTCSTCKFWEEPTPPPAGREAVDLGYGRCHFNAPVVLLTISAQTFWPKTMPTDWCGQFVALP